jgi:hypothetical protein
MVDTKEIHTRLMNKLDGYFKNMPKSVVVSMLMDAVMRIILPATDDADNPQSVDEIRGTMDSIAYTTLALFLLERLEADEELSRVRQDVERN